MRYEWIEKLHRDMDHKVIGGVCSGLAEYFNLDVLIFRLIFVLGLFSTYPFVLLYIILWAIIPKR